MLTLEQTGFALAIVFGGGTLILLLGTQILDWYWLTLLTVTALAVSAIRIRNRMVTRYRVAQLLDNRLQLSDALSTAWYLLSEPDRGASSIAQFQIKQAEQIAASIEPALAFPSRRHRTWKLACVLGAVMCGLFVLRYFVQSKLNFEQSLIPIHLESALERLNRSLTAENQPSPGITDEEANTEKTSHSEKNSVRREMPRPQNPNLEQQRKPTDNTKAATEKIAAQERANPQNGSGQTESGEVGQQRNSNDSGNRDGLEQTNTPRPATKEQSADNQQSPSSSLLEKMKDALSSLLAKMSPTANSQNSVQKAESSDPGKSEELSAGSKQQESQSPNAQKQEGREGASSDGEQQGQTTENTQASAGHDSDSSTDNNASDAQSGIGRQDGQKELKEAEQLQAMGKLAEIIGKRSANLTGEITIETSSGKQQLKTEYSQRVGQHSDLGGEINRDEIPLMYRQYIREYMDRVHNQAKPKR